MQVGRLRELAASGIFLFALSASASAEKLYGPGVTDTEIKIGQTMPYSGPVSAYGTVGRAQAAYFEMINAKGGVNGRQIRLISLDDAFSPPKTVEQTRKLVESDNVLLIFSSLGTPTNSAIYARYILEHNPAAKIGVLYQNDDFGREYLKGLEERPERSALVERPGASCLARLDAAVLP